MQLKKYILSDVAKVEISGVDKKTKEGETPVKLCNFTDVYYNWAITKDMEPYLMQASANTNEIRRFSLKKGQVAFTKDSETRDDIGVPTYIADDFDNVVLGYHCALITPDESKVLGAYLNAYMHTTTIQKYFENNASGSGQRYTLSVETMEKMPLFLPSIEEQKHIADLFSNLDRKIALNRQINQNLEALAKQLYDYWFVQFDFPDENGKPYKSSGGAMVYNEQLKRDIPKGWEYFTTDKLTNVITGKEDANFSVPNGAYPFFTCSRENLRCATPAFAGKAILIAGNGDFNVKHYNGTFNAYQRTYVLIPKDSKYYGVLYFAALERIDLFKAKSNGSIIKFITKGDVENIGVSDCHKPEIYKQINTLIEAIETNECEITSLIKQRNELLPLLMNGQVNFDLSAC